MSEASLEALVALTRTMLERARAGAWDEVNRLEDERISLMNASITTSPVGASRAVLEELRRMNDELVALATAERDQLAEQLGQLRSSGNAAKAYQANE